MAKRTVSEAEASKAIAKRIKSVDEINSYAKMLIYGRNKNGKTVFASKAPNVLLIDIDEEGSRSAHGSGAHVVQVKTFDEVAHVYWYLKAGNHEFESVAIDTITTLQECAIRKVLGEAEDRDPTREPSTPDRRTWGRANQLVKQLLLDFRNLPMHVIFLAQERVVDDEDSDEPALHTVSLPAGSRSTALGCVGLIGRIYLKEVRDRKAKKNVWEARILVGPHEQYDTGNRIGLPRIIRADMDQVLEAWANNPEE